MAIFEVQAPDGTTYEIEAPDNASDTDVLEYFQSQQPASTSYIEDAVSGFKGGAQSVQNLFGTNLDDSKNTYWQDLGGKLKTGILDIADYATNPTLRQEVNQSYTPTEARAGLLQGFGESPSGQAFNALMVNPVINAAGTAINKYAIPAAAEATGIAPTDIQLGLLGAPLAIKGAQAVAPQTMGAIGNVAGKVINAPMEGLKQLGKSETLGKFALDTSSRTKKAPIMTAQEFRTKANESYTKAAEQGGILSPELTNKFIDESNKLQPQTAEGQLISGTTAATELLQKAQQLRDKPLSLQAAQEIDSAMTAEITKYVDPLTGRPTAEGLGLIKIQDKFRDTINSATEKDIAGGKTGFDSWKEGKDYWARAAKLNDIEKIISRAELMEQPSTGIKSGFRTLASNPKRMAGYTKQEQALIRKAAKTGIVTGAFRLAGSGLVPIGTLVAGGGIGGAAGAYLGSSASKAIANKMQVGKANKVAAAITNRGQTPPPATPLNQVTFQQLFGNSAMTPPRIQPRIRTPQGTGQ